MGPEPTTGIFIRRRKFGHKPRYSGKTLCDNEAQTGVVHLPNQGTPVIASSRRKLGRAREDPPLGPAERLGPTRTS